MEHSEEQQDPNSVVCIQGTDLVKTYARVTAVDSISFRVMKGEAFGLLGPNGAGKSTVMRIIYCRTPLSAGELTVEGLDVRNHSKRIKTIVGVVPQENNLDPDLNVIENLLVYSRYFRIPRREAARRVEELLDFMGLSAQHSTPVEALSGGMRRRLIIARALINRPRILILDEPTTGLDPHARHELWDRLRELRRRKITIVLSTHYMEEAEKLCDRLIIMDHGKILISGNPQRLIEENASKFVLEIHDADGLQPERELPSIRTELHGSTLYCFASSPEFLTPLVARYASYKSLLRPANLEDVFLRLTGRDRLE